MEAKPLLHTNYPERRAHRHYARVIAQSDRQTANTHTLHFVLGQTVRRALVIALLMLVAESLNVAMLLPMPQSRLVLAVALGATSALKALWINRWRSPELLSGN